MISVCPFLCTCDGKDSVQILGKICFIGLCLVAAAIQSKALRSTIVDVIIQRRNHLLEFFIVCFFVICNKCIQVCRSKNVLQHLTICDQAISLDVVWNSIVSFTFKLKFQGIRYALIQSLEFWIGNLIDSFRIPCRFPFLKGNRIRRKYRRIFL